MTSTTEFDVTQRLIQNYAEDWKVQHSDAMECRDCEDFLARGVQLLQWIENLDAKFREADARGCFDYSRQFYNAVTELYRAWLVPCDHANAWISKVGGIGYTPDNLADFQSACECVRATIEDREWLARSEAALHTSLQD